MKQEIERKFLVNGDFKSSAYSCLYFVQGYLSSVPERSVRVRIADGKGYLTIKGISDSEGTTRFEWEKEISAKEAQELIKLCEPGIIEKKRYLIRAGEHIFEVDEFMGDNSGLIIAEIELNREDEAFEKPFWLGQEVTGVNKYYNVSLSRNPYCSWEDKL